MAMAYKDSGAASSDRLTRIETTVSNIADDMRDVKSELHGITETMLPRTEAQARISETDRRLLDMQTDINARLESKEYNIAHEALVQRVARMETNPQRQLGWISLAVSGAIGCFTLIITAAGVIVSVIVLYLSQKH